MSAYHLAVFAYIWEENKFPQENFSIDNFKKTVDKIAEETEYWVLTSKINSEKNPIKKTLLKAKRKVA